MSIEQWLKTNTHHLATAGITTARLDCLVLVEDITGISRASLLADSDQLLTDKQLKLLDAAVEQRAKHIPLSYIRGRTEFYGREFAVTPAVLEPRPESETIIELLLSLKLPDSTKIVDVGCGSGALGITAALELPNAEVALVDINDAALAVAEQNCQRYGLELQCIVDNLLTHAKKRGVSIDVILANLPYVPDDYQINTAAQHEPRIAIFGGPDGLTMYRTLFQQAANLKVQHILTESLPFQHDQLAEVAKKHGYQQASKADLVQLFTLSS